MHGHAHREGAARVHHLAQRQPVTPDREHRDGVASGVHGIQKGIAPVEGQRALRSQMVHDGPTEDPAQPTGVVGVRQGEGAIVGAVVRDDSVTGGAVGLDEDDVIGALPEMRLALVTISAGGTSTAQRCQSTHRCSGDS